MKPHTFAQMVNEVRDLAFDFGTCEQFRDRVADLLGKYIPADRVLGDGEIKTLESERRELALLRQHFQLFEKEHSDDLSEADLAFSARQEVDELPRKHYHPNHEVTAT